MSQSPSHFPLSPPISLLHIGI